jgi:hypothetical protein
MCPVEELRFGDRWISLGEVPPVIRRPLSTAAALATIALTATACGDDDAPDPIPGTESSSTSSAPTEPTEPTETATTPSWEDDYTPKQIRAYEAALQRFESYEQRSEPIWAEGAATPAAEALFKDYFPSPQWQFLFHRLEDYEQVEVRSEGTAHVYWTRAKSITRDGLNVEIEQCVDYTSITNTQRGEAIEPDPWATHPRLRAIRLSKPEGYDWLIYQLSDATSEPRPQRCDR